ncbi:8-amino-7-oxononanoate synthase [Stenoxybacter acetivorans]|uniref:8-amino-7-oxononanoate synthase n=1 Tax=Stenoxybacter acetivorans TaxID=422441 RepID=UPI0005681DB1|nr:8-amino-7-oxononanoate synthase [Stenoxybacter acetivorans]
MTTLLDDYAAKLNILRQQGRLRRFSHALGNGKTILLNGKPLLNLASNDYLGVAGNAVLRERFFAESVYADSALGSVSSRLLIGNHAAADELETAMAAQFGRSVLLFNSGYHANIGILPAASDKHTLILADKWVHASLIDGIRLSAARCVRYRHNDLQQLRQLLERHADDVGIKRIIIVTESLFSMDGDEADLLALVRLKQQFPKVMLYVDEAHAFGVRGKNGLGCAEEQNVLADIDFLVGAFGKAAASAGGFVVCHALLRDYLINTARPLIFSTALPPLNWAWTLFVFEQLIGFKQERTRLQHIAALLRQAVQRRYGACASASHIVPIITGSDDSAADKARTFQAAGFYVLPIRPPTVPENTARVRLSLRADLTDDDLAALVTCV